MKNKETVLITGINGFLGSAVANNILKEYNVIGLDISSSDNFRLADIMVNITCYNVDEFNLNLIFEKHSIDFIIHTATNFGKDGDFMNVIKPNLIFPLQLLQLAIDHGTKAFINADTFYSPDYGVLQNYSLSKNHFLDWAKLLSAKIKIINLKFGVIFGPKDNRDKFTVLVIRKMLSNEPNIDLTNGFQKRNFLYVDEAAKIFKTIVNKNDVIKLQFSSFNAGTGESTSIREYISRIHLLSGSKSKLNFGAIEYRENEIMNPDADISGILNLGWKPILSLDEALISTIEYERQV